MSKSSTFKEVAEDHARSLLAAGRTEEDAARELGTLAATLAAEGQIEFAQALTHVSRRHRILAMAACQPLPASSGDVHRNAR